MSLHIALVPGILAAVLCSACSSTSTSLMPGSRLVGRWGGLHADMALTESGGTIQFDCAHGAIGSAVVTDATSDFDVAGIFVREHGGPIRVGEIPDSLMARYLGHVTVDHLRLVIRVGADTLGPYELQLNGAPQLVRCL